MARKQTRRVDRSTRRCRTCGHPITEHRRIDGCTVPKCACEIYEPAAHTGGPPARADDDKVSRPAK